MSVAQASPPAPPGLTTRWAVLRSLTVQLLLSVCWQLLAAAVPLPAWLGMAWLLLSMAVSAYLCQRWRNCEPGCRTCRF